MAESKTEATTYACDAEKCDVTHVCVGLQEPKGIRLTAEVDGKDPVKAYACKATHIRPAVEAALEKGAEHPGENDGFGWHEGERGEDVPNADPADDDEKTLEELEAHPVAVGQ